MLRKVCLQSLLGVVMWESNIASQGIGQHVGIGVTPEIVEQCNGLVLWQASQRCDDYIQSIVLLL